MPALLARLRDDSARGHGRLRLGQRRTTSSPRSTRNSTRCARRDETARRDATEALEDELGDLLFACANYARKLGVEPEAALRRAADKFQSRFARMEELAAADGTTLKELPLDRQNALWDMVKRESATVTPGRRKEAP